MPKAVRALPFVSNPLSAFGVNGGSIFAKNGGEKLPLFTT
jgi:hypothetical protein